MKELEQYGTSDTESKPVKVKVFSSFLHTIIDYMGLDKICLRVSSKVMLKKAYKDLLDN